MAALAKSRNELPLKKKMEVIRMAQSSKFSLRRLAEEFGIGKTQVGSILKRKRDIEDAFDRNESPDKRRCSYKTPLEDVNTVTWEWFTRMRGQNIPISGPMIQQQAREYATSLGIDDFKASNGWLESFKKRHNVGQSKLCGESASVDCDTVTDWHSRLASLCEGYTAEDIYNMDETGMFYRALPDKSLVVRGSDCHGGKHSKERLTVVLTCNMKGDFLKPLVIGKAAKPRCFKNIDATSLPVTWRNNKKAWMTGALFTEWIQDLDKKMRLQQRQILLFLDNAPCHPKDVTLTNVKVLFYPPNTTSRLQPLDQGIIQNLKAHYRKRLLRRVITAINSEETPSASTIANTVNVLDCCHWVSGAMKDIKPQTVINCFVHAGYPRSLASPAADTPVTDPTAELEPLISAVSLSLSLPQPLSAQDFVDVDSDAPAIEELSPTWQQDLLEGITRAEGDSDTVSDTSEDSHSVPETEPEPVPNSEIRDFKTALYWIQQVKNFALDRNLAPIMNSCVDVEELLTTEIVAARHVSKQTTIHSFFSKQ